MLGTSRTARQARVCQIVREHPIRSQGELLELLAADGIDITQATLSRDLVELGAGRVRRGRSLVYALPHPDEHDEECSSTRLRRTVAELLVSAEASENLVVLRTPPGGAQYLASTLDQSRVPDVLGTIAGDDTVLVVTRGRSGGDRLARDLLAMTSVSH